jgi:hypothetical protein
MGRLLPHYNADGLPVILEASIEMEFYCRSRIMGCGAQFVIM